MKKAICLALICVLLFACCTAALADAYEKPILFRGIPWGSAFTEAKDKLPADLHIYRGTKDTWYKIDDSLFMTQEENALYSGENLGASYYADSASIRKAGGVKVAGYAIKQLYMYFICRANEKGTLATDDGQNSLIYAAYYFDVQQTDAVYADLLTKLTSLYGDVDLTREQDGTLQNLWYGAEGTMVALINAKGSISIRYGFSGADELIETAHQVLNYGEVMLAGDDVDGL